MGVSIVIPALDEIDDLPRTIERLRALDPPADEIVVADGGSSDGTREWLAVQTGLRVVDAGRGRGVQMNSGAEGSTSEILLFLHADAEPPADVLSRVERALHDPAIVGGAFTIRFARRDGSPRSMALIARGINARTWATRSATGDQAIFVRREAFERLGGFRPWPLFEDVDLVTRIKSLGGFVIVAGPVTISDRRYAKFGPWRTTALMWRLRLRYWAGTSPEELKRAFVDVRRS